MPSPMDRLIEGYREFRATAWAEHRRRFERLAERGQRPRALVIACSDSRVDPQMIFNAGPGEPFVVRNVANLVPPYAPDAEYHGTSAAVEFAVRVLEVDDVVVMGHGRCGGIVALLEGAPPEAADFVAPWVAMATPARERARAALGAQAPAEALQLCCEHESVKLSLANLRSFPWLAARERDGLLALHGCHFAVATGALWKLGADGAFAPV
jgi:carbonic anhydrase